MLTVSCVFGNVKICSLQKSKMVSASNLKINVRGDGSIASHYYLPMNYDRPSSLSRRRVDGLFEEGGLVLLEEVQPGPVWPKTSR